MATPGRRAAQRVLAAVLLLGTLAACGGGSAAQESAYVAPDRRDPAPQLRGSGLDGARLDTAEWRGGPVVLNVWGSWCGPCRAEQPELERAHRELAPAGVHFAGINIRDEAASARAFVRSFDVTYPSFSDKSSALLGRLARGRAGNRKILASAVPSTFVLDGRGRIAAYLPGATTYDELTALVRRVLAEPA